MHATRKKVGAMATARQENSCIGQAYSLAQYNGWTTAKERRVRGEGEWAEK
jgi:hypothetical protein